jgi:AraC-like DNA-binding protein
MRQRSEESRLPVGYIVAEKVPRSIARQLAKLCSPQLSLLTSTTAGVEIPPLVAVCMEGMEAGELVGASWNRYSTRLVASDPESVGISSTKLSFDVAEPRSRLALLAWLSQRTLAITKGVEPPGWLHLALLRQVASVQCGLDLQLTERALSARLDVAPSTLRRWFDVAGSVSCGRLLLCIRAYVLSRRLFESGLSSAQVSEQLGFQHVESARRLLRNLGTSVGALRAFEGQDRLEQQIRNEIIRERSRP